MALSSETIAKFSRVSTATLTTQLFKRGLRNVFIQDVRRMSAASGNLVGEAFTLRYIPAREDLDQLSVFENPEHPQRKAVETVPPCQVLVMDCRRDARAASGGNILLMRLKVRGVAGVVTDGGLRDSEAIGKMDFPVYGAGGSAPLNLAIHHAVDLNVPIGCGGVAVFPGDVIVGDGEGVVVLPEHLADELADEAVEMTAFEDFVMEQVHMGRSILGLYPATDERTLEDFAAWRAANKR